MAPITSSDGPVAVTGAAGYIGSYVVKNLVEHGYAVRACVRDKSRKDKTEHLAAMNGHGVGQVEIIEADMTEEGAYNGAFRGCSAVFHVATELGHGGYDNFWGDGKKMYDGIIDGTKNVLGAIELSGSVKRLIYTSSGAAVKGPGPPGYFWSEADFCGVGGPDNPHRSEFPYGIGKMHAELMCYKWGEQKGIDVVTIIPEHAIGPLMCLNHDFGWQHDIGEIFCGRYHVNQLWGITDVRDLGQAYRLAAESSTAGNGSRYFVVTPHAEGGAPTPPTLVEIMRSIYPGDTSVCGTKPAPGGQEYMPIRTTKAKDELGLRFTHYKDSIKDTVESLKGLGVIDKIRAKIAQKAAEKDARSKL
mmetsp:Transcript_99664/g.277562  ORF Transcript_99664/g.277562 Transcript_99664/m.277562 type:complete len:359 (+) Transcript_99664:33-1109(+)